MQITILAIESSCDETSASVVRDGVILSNVVASQEVHQQYGGVVPELASRAHQKHIVPVVQQALVQAGVSQQELSAIAFTQGPGLLGALMVGASFAKGMALSLGIPLIGVNHMRAHILAHFIEDPRPQFPFLCLTVSGGHTQLVVVRDYLDMEVIGETQDDAVGEAFDKAAKVMGLPYPGGPLIDKYAQGGNPEAYSFPDVSTPGLNFSFSGLKTSFLYFIQQNTQKNPRFVEEHLQDICASIQHTFVRTLMKKLKRAAREEGIRDIAIAGGVSANSGLRTALAEAGKKHGWRVFIPRFEYCTDNAAMIAITAYFQFLKGAFVDLRAVPTARMKLEARQRPTEHNE